MQLPALDFPTAFAIAGLSAWALTGLLGLLGRRLGEQGLSYAMLSTTCFGAAYLCLALQQSLTLQTSLVLAYMGFAAGMSAMALCYQRFRGCAWGPEDRALLIAPWGLLMLSWVLLDHHPLAQERARGAMLMGLLLWQVSLLLRMRHSSCVAGWRLAVLAQSAQVLSLLPIVAVGVSAQSLHSPGTLGAGLAWSLFAVMLLGFHATVYGYLHMLHDRHSEMQHQAAQLDSLTQLPSRRTLMAHIPTAMEQAEQAGTPLGLLVLDIDHFKMINDMYGHWGGDAVLQRVAWVLRTQVRKEDFVARYGGEEFVLLIPNATPALLLSTAQRIGNAVRAESVAHDGARIEVSVSLGGHVQKVTQGLRWEELLAAADTALYEAKHTGRDRVVLSVVSRAQLPTALPIQAAAKPRRGPEAGERRGDATHS